MVPVNGAVSWVRKPAQESRAPHPKQDPVETKYAAAHRIYGYCHVSYSTVLELQDFKAEPLTEPDLSRDENKFYQR